MPNHSDAAPKGRKSQDKARRDRQALSADQVATYLRQHPDFLTKHPELLEVLAPPHARRDGVVDFQSYMVDRLQEEIGVLTNTRDILLTTGRTNLTAQARVHEAILALLSAESFEHFIETITTDLSVILDLAVVTIGVAQLEEPIQSARLNGIFRLEPHRLDEIMGPSAGIILNDHIEGDPRVFGAGAGLVRSEAIIRLTIGTNVPAALLALGSRQPDQFYAGQGTELLVFLSRVLECCFHRWLELA